MPVQGPRGPEGSPRFGLIFRESRYHILLLPLLPFRPFRPVPHFLLSHFSASSSSSPLPLDCSLLQREGGGTVLSLDASPWMNIALPLIVAAALYADILIMPTSRNTLCKYHIYAVEGCSGGEDFERFERVTRKEEIFNFLRADGKLGQRMEEKIFDDICKSKERNMDPPSCPIRVSNFRGTKEKSRVD